MAIARIFFSLICLSTVIGYRLPDGHLLNDPSRQQLVDIAASQLHVRETQGANRGPEIKAYLAYTGLPQGYPYCAAFISWVYGKAGFSQPKTAWSPALFPQNRLIKNAQPGDVIGIFSSQLNRIAHCGLVEKKQGDWILSIEGNTNADGHREGDGVYRKRRHQKTIYRIANWISGQKGVPNE